MPALFLSDIHLEADRPIAQDWLIEFLAGPAAEADAVYILGDLFEYWIGDDAPSSAALELAAETSRLAAAGIPCYFIHGNRDFLLGEDYAARAGLSLLPEETVVDLYGTPTLLLHGDTLCTDDVTYQAVRQQTRDPAWQAAVLARTVEERMALARSARDASAQHTGMAASEIMDVNESAVRQAFHRHAVARMIHGHTHRPAFHRHDLGGGRTGERIVLADWYEAASYLRVTADRAESVSLSD
jgi:UDP-2,3-diacylglucosamine hydrolase